MPKAQISPDLLTAFAAADSHVSRAELLHAEEILTNPEAVQALCDQANHWARADLTLARKSAEAALWLADTLAHPRSQGLAHRTVANILASLGRPSPAFSNYTAALAIFERLGDSHQAAITRSSALPIVTDTQGAATALAWAAQAREVFQETGDRLRLARLENNLAVLFFRQEDYIRAHKHWTKAYNTLQLIGETLDQATALRNLAVCSISLNQPFEAKSYYKRARKLCETHNFTFLLHTIDYNIAYLHYLEGDHYRALELYQAARSRSRELGDTYHEAYCSLDEAEVYIELNLLKEADTAARLAATQFQEQQRPYEAAKALFNLALVVSRRGEARTALDHLGAASKAISGQGNILWPGQVELLRSTIFFSEGRYFEATRSASIGLSLFQDSGLITRAATAELLLGKLHLAQGLLTEAEATCRGALQSLEPLGEPDSLFQAYYLLGKILDAQAASSAAYAALLKSEEYLRELRERRTSSPTRVSIIEQPLDLYADLVALLLEHGHTAPREPELFHLIETAKVRSFADLTALSPGHAQQPTKMRSQLVDQVSNLRQELTWLYRRIDRSELPDSRPKPSVIESLQAQSQEKEAELARVLSLLRSRRHNTDPASTRIAIPDVEATQSLLEDHAFLEFFLSHDLVVALILTRTQLNALPVAVTSTVQDLQRRLIYYLQHEAQRTSARPQQSSIPLDRILDKLYQELLLPLEPFLGDRPLIISPHSFLFLVPFHALRKAGKHLIDRVPVTYVTSAADLSSEMLDQAVPFRNLGVVGLPAGEDPGTVFQDLGEHLQRVYLPTAKLDSKTVQGTAAMDCTAIHVIAGAGLRDDNPLFSSLRFNDTQITFLDLYQSRMLSPVLTIEGNGFAPAGSGGYQAVSCLWRGLLSSGATCALVPTGPNSETAQRRYAELFYRELLSGSPAGEANRRALRQFRTLGAALHEWAGLSLLGQPLFRLSTSSGQRGPDDT